MQGVNLNVMLNEIEVEILARTNLPELSKEVLKGYSEKEVNS